MGLPFHKLKRLWLLYVFLLFFAFFMFAISINVYIQSLQTSELHRHRQRTGEQRRRHAVQTPKNVIVAHYIGRGDIFGNMTEEEYNIDQFNPVHLEGADGRPVIVPARDSFRMQRYFKLNSFNVLASDRIPLNRTLKDYRISECRSKTYPIDLPTTSIIIVFHNEAWSVLLRTITSIINRSPRQLIKEIILVDDASTRTYLKKPLEDYLQTFNPKPLLLRIPKRSGLVPARLLGASQASGDVLTFLDAHCECSEGWLEPLLARVKEQRNVVVCPVIDIISDDNFSYTKTFENHWGAFNWQLSFRWFATKRSGKNERHNDATKPITTPAMAGGLFAIDRVYFYEIGSYDAKMKIWGGENVEMSFRIWQCGGRVEIIPCSHVGHIFRSSTPYTFPGGMSEILGVNLARAAMVWMDDWQYFVLLYTSGLSLATREKIDVSERLLLRKNLQCKPFSWYLQHIWPEHFFPAHDRFFGKIIWLDGETDCAQAYSAHMRNIPGRFISREWPRIFKAIEANSEKFVTLLDLDRDNCLRPANIDAPHTTSQPVTVGDCNAHANSMDLYVITPEGQIKSNDNICLTYSKFYKANPKLVKGHNSATSNVQIAQCYQDQQQLWDYDMSTQQIQHRETKLCLTLRATASEDVGKSSKIVLVMECDFKDITQKWGLIPLPWKL